MKQYLLLAGLLLASLFASAQVYEEGMIVTTAGDTMRGFVAKYDDQTMAFKKERSGARDLVNMKDIASYTFEGSDYEQHVVEVLRGNFPERVQAYLRVVVDGKPLRLLEYKGTGLFGSEHVNYYLHHDEAEVPYRVNKNPGNFKTTMKHYFGEDEELATRIKKGELGYENLVEIVTQFNAWWAAQPEQNGSEEGEKAQ